MSHEVSYIVSRWSLRFCWRRTVMTVILCKMDAAGNYFVRKMAMHY